MINFRYIALLFLVPFNACATSADCVAAYVTGDYSKAVQNCSRKWSNILDQQVGYYVFAEMYELGRGVKKSIDRALLYYGKSAEAGYPPALVRLGNYYTDIDNCKALFYFRQASIPEWEGQHYAKARVKLLREGNDSCAK